MALFLSMTILHRFKKKPFNPFPFSHISHSTMNKHSWEKKKQCTPGDPFEQVTLIQSKLLADNTEWNIRYGINSILNSYTHTRTHAELPLDCRFFLFNCCCCFHQFYIVCKRLSRYYLVFVEITVKINFN